MTEKTPPVLGKYCRFSIRGTQSNNSCPPRSHDCLAVYYGRFSELIRVCYVRVVFTVRIIAFIFVKTRAPISYTMVRRTRQFYFCFFFFFRLRSTKIKKPRAVSARPTRQLPVFPGQSSSVDRSARVFLRARPSLALRHFASFRGRARYRRERCSTTVARPTPSPTGDWRGEITFFVFFSCKFTPNNDYSLVRNIRFRSLLGLRTAASPAFVGVFGQLDYTVNHYSIIMRYEHRTVRV